MTMELNAVAALLLLSVLYLLGSEGPIEQLRCHGPHLRQHLGSDMKAAVGTLVGQQQELRKQRDQDTVAGNSAGMRSRQRSPHAWHRHRGAQLAGPQTDCHPFPT